MRIGIECSALEYRVGVVKAHIDEGINQITMIELELATRDTIASEDLGRLIGQAITLVIEDTIDNQLHKVRWDGFIFEMIDITMGVDDNSIYYYTMVVRPKLWQLNYCSHSRSYPEMSRVAVIDELLKEHGFTEDSHYTKNYNKEDDYPVFNQLLQTGNSDLSFFRSLLVNAGINYYFSCDEEAEKEEMLHLVDHVAFFPNHEGDIPVSTPAGFEHQGRKVEQITRLIRAVPCEVNSVAFLADGDVKCRDHRIPVTEAGTEGVVNIFVPEGLSDSEKTAKQACQMVSEGFTASRIVHQGIADHMKMRPGKRISIRDDNRADSYSMLVVKARHTIEQTVQAALAESGSGDASYKNYFQGAEPMAPIRPHDAWTNVDEQMTLDCSLDLDPRGKASISPKFKYVPNSDFNPDNDPALNTEGIKEIVATVTMLQEQVRALRARVQSLESSISANGSGLVCAEITKDAWVTEGKELVCMVKAEEFENPIVVKASVAWHDRGGGSLHLPRKGNHVWIQRIHRTKGNDWVIVGYRPSGKVPSSNNPSGQFSIEVLG